MDEKLRALIVNAALDVRRRAYAPHSGFLVGAALLTAEGTIVQGCNVENDSYGLTICAERVAVASAVALGQRSFEMLAVASAGGLAPCGACRQVLAQFCDHLEILLVDAAHPDRVVEVRLSDLLPSRFSLRS